MGYKSYNQGYFTPRNPQKYKGDVEKIRYMSSWEYKCNEFLDSNPNVLEWASEEIVIPYVKPTTGRVHRYFPDYCVRYKNKHGEIVTEIWEVKPKSQIKRPRKNSRNPKTALREALTYEVNKAKWAAATQFCNKYGMKFRLVSEMSIFK